MIIYNIILLTKILLATYKKGGGESPRAADDLSALQDDVDPPLDEPLLVAGPPTTCLSPKFIVGKATSPRMAPECFWEK